RERGWRVTRLDQYGRPKDPTAPIIELPTLPFPSDRYTVSMDFVLHLESFRGRPDVVAVVETLGERAARKGSTLKIAEIPDDFCRHIAENAGLEWVAEAHRVCH